MSTSLVESFQKGLKSANPQAEIRVIDLLNYPVEFCKGCSDICAKADQASIGGCVTKDGMADALKEMIDCDCLVFATPIYCMLPTALFKKFMERCLPLLYYTETGPRSRNQKRKGKKALIITSTGAPYLIDVIFGLSKASIKILSRMANVAGCSKVLSVKAGGMESSPKLKEKFLKQAYDMGIRLAK